MGDRTSQPGNPKIAIQSVTKSFGGFVALDRVSLDVGAGEFFVIVGPSGCGKTTLLRILGGLEQQSAGDVVLSGVDPARPSNSIVFQGDSIFPWMNVFDNAAYGLRMRRLPARDVQEIVRPYLEKMGLWRFRQRPSLEVDAYLTGGRAGRGRQPCCSSGWCRPGCSWRRLPH